MYYQASPLDARQLIIVDGTNFADLLFFWNLRARATSSRGHGVVAIPRQALSFPERLRSLVEWTAGEHGVIKPDLLIHARDTVDHETVAAALGELGFSEAAPGPAPTVYLGGVPTERRDREFGFLTGGLLGGKMRRGI